jgi:hypothetical protein
VSNEVRSLLSRAITRLLAGDRTEFEKLAVEAEQKYREDSRLYVTIQEILDTKAMKNRMRI